MTTAYAVIVTTDFSDPTCYGPFSDIDEAEAAAERIEKSMLWPYDQDVECTVARMSAGGHGLCPNAARYRQQAARADAASTLYSLLEEIRDAALPEGSLWVDDIDTALAAARGEKKEVKP